MRTSEKPPREANGGRAGLSAPASRKLPVPPRERKPALAALAVLLIVGGALATTLLMMRTGDRVSAIRITQQIAAGQPIALAAMEEVQVAQTGVDYVPWRLRQQVARTYARVPLIPGTLLIRQMTTSASEELGPGKAIVGLALKAGQMPADLAKGQRVQVIHVPARAAEGAARVLVQNALVHTIGPAGRSGSGGLVSIIVDTAEAPEVALHSSSGEVALAVLPGAG
ncbi:hypothetical protein AB0K60_37345 [Thermopolyspora sp. NPDC052614]|uniref:hypothetical protein n=1 Tax=Thermopolyspora sp. NPDC052614 TaxID=3155682 RepID=UPI00343630CA